MGARYLKAEEEEIVNYYPTASSTEMCKRIPHRTWAQIGARARRMGVHRTPQAKGNSVRDGRKSLKDAWSDSDNERFDTIYPNVTHTQLFVAFPDRTLSSIQAHASDRHLYRTREAKVKQIAIGRENART